MSSPDQEAGCWYDSSGDVCSTMFGLLPDADVT